MTPELKVGRMTPNYLDTPLRIDILRFGLMSTDRTQSKAARTSAFGSDTHCTPYRRVNVTKSTVGGVEIALRWFCEASNHLFCFLGVSQAAQLAIGVMATRANYP